MEFAAEERLGGGGGSGEDDAETIACASAHAALEQSARLEELSSDARDEDEEEACAAARSMELRPSAVQEAVLTGATIDVEHMDEVQAPLQAAVASQAHGPSPLFTASKCVATDDILRRHDKHVFILTSAGKPVFTRHGDEREFSEVFGVFQVIMAMARQRHGDAAAMQQQRQHESLRRIKAGDLSLYFYVAEELIYVLVTRTGESMRSCMSQLRQIHLQLLGLVPNVSSILSRCPSYDLRRLISSTESGVLRQLIRRYSREECYLFRCLAAAPLSVKWRRLMESLLAQHHGTGFPTPNSTDGSDENPAADASHSATAKNHLYSFVFFRGRVVCAVGPADSDAPLHVEDVLVLLNFTRCLADSQVGEIWAPLCLPMYNNTGYLWCYCANMSVMARGQQQQQLSQRLTGCEHHGEGGARDSTAVGGGARKNVAALDALVYETPARFAKSEGILMVHIAASQEAFVALAEQTCQVARHLMSEIAQLEEELSRLEHLPLSLVMSAESVEEQKRQLLLLSCDTAPALVASSDFLNVDRNILPSVSIHPDGLQWFAAVLRGNPRRGGTATLVYSEPSAAMRLSSRERKRLLRLVVEQRDRLAQCSRSAEPLMLLRMDDVNLLVMRTTATLVASLMEQFYTTGARNVLSPSAESGGSGADFISVEGAMFASSRMRELLLLFSPEVSNPQMLRCALQVLVRVVAREAELSFQQVRGGRR
ncbi:putative vacuolar fusion protein MON1 B-like [Trypanosoma rangeli]|uniref:Putative vacuolar fusion protein MON1 B-like n=1 Tax=Trypanosoma rangeli TaxID=5698 RepID=A0A422N7B5_TRYRA|nr:putative vacuolar fusion protein MON1 B-like [Trypanosoma rangeli]RNF01341.1 putative vacuolar fusion protein MON1 B-like [Trypanosoma rangeli]|eukprot:RNF01341.1 putative vacuolar fusion protein MON1 B-like [Trypanosoma rangeli]